MRDMPWKEAILKVLEENKGVEMSNRDIANAVIKRGYRTSVGKTPPNTVSARMSQVMDEYGVQRVRQGIYMSPVSNAEQHSVSNPVEEQNSVPNQPEAPAALPDATGISVAETSNSKETWTLREAKAHLMQILRLSQVDGPQYISVSQVENQHIQGHQTFVIIPEEVWREKNPPKKTLGQMLLEDMPKGIGEKEPEYDESGRYIPFSDVIWE